MAEFDYTERTAVERLLVFAQLPQVKCAADVAGVYQLFAHDAGTPALAEVLPGTQPGEAQLRPMWFLPLTAGGPTDADAPIIEGDRTEAQALVQAFAASPPRARRNHGAEVGALATMCVLAARPQFDGTRMTVTPLPQGGVQARYGYGLALLYDRTRPFGKALRRCALEDCRRFFLSFARGAGGQHPKYCCDAHQRAADKVRAVARARKWRRDRAAAKK